MGISWKSDIYKLSNPSYYDQIDWFMESIKANKEPIGHVTEKDISEDRLTFEAKLTKEAYDAIMGPEHRINMNLGFYPFPDRPPQIDRVIFNNPATIVFWKDGTKTVVKKQKGDRYSKEAGLALCYMKKVLGNKGNFNNQFRKWCGEETK